MTLALFLVSRLAPAAPPLPEIDTDLLHRLSSRHGIDCAALGDATPALRDDLVALTDRSLKPSSVPVRAASCLVQRFSSDPSVRAAVLGWIADPGSEGLALAAVQAVHASGADASFQAELVAAIATVPEAARRARLQRRAAR